MVHKKTLRSWIYLSTAFSNWKHQKLSGDENRDISSCRWVRLCRVMTHSEGPYLSSTRIQCLQLRAFKCVISSANVAILNLLFKQAPIAPNKIDRQSAFQTSQKGKNNRISFTLAFHPHNRAVKSVILKNFKWLQNDLD